MRSSEPKEDTGIEQLLQYLKLQGVKKIAPNCLSWKYVEMIMIANEVIPENLVVVY